MFKLVVLFSVLALAAAKPNVWAPLAYNTVPAAVSSVSQYNSVLHGSPLVPAVYGASYAPYLSGVVPVNTWSQAPNSPAVVLDAVNGVPLDTPEVVAARVAHYHAKALNGVHQIAKRSVFASAPYSSVVPVEHVSPVYRSIVSPLAYPSPLVSTYNAHVAPYTYGGVAVVPKALSVHPW